MQMKHMLKPSDVVVVIFHDHGTRYMGKMFNDDWMRERGFLVEEKPSAMDMLKGRELQLLSVEADEPVLKAIDMMRTHHIDQLPVFENGKPVGTITDAHLFDAIVEDADVRTQAVRAAMGPALPVIEMDATLEEVCAHLGNGSRAVLVKIPGLAGNAGTYGIITKQDIIGKLK